ncbi:MAG TPA: T9SS type A sorting domain-containing protein [Bacteroidia bacterium]|jgi:Leucine-rich repeat (LRR) protein
MKNTIIAGLIFCCSAEFAAAQNVNIPDANFKAALVGNPSINTNNDAEIQVSEASAYNGNINVTGLGIADLTGIEAFTAITGLDCSYNTLTNLNVSNNTMLTSLYCNNNSLANLNVSSNTALINFDCSVNALSTLNVSSNTNLSVLGCNNNNLTSLNTSANTNLSILDCDHNQLGSLNVSGNTGLTTLYCGYNAITNLSVSANTALTTLGCYHNQLSSLVLTSNTNLRYLNCQFNNLAGLDVSGNHALTQIGCYNNQLTSLNVKNGNNSNFTAFYAQNNPNLACIEVDNPAYMNANWSAGKDPSATFSTNCLNTDASDIPDETAFTISPNPSPGIFTINLNSDKKASILIYDIMGSELKRKDFNRKEQVDLTGEAAGIYFVELRTDEMRVIRKLVIR